uniref:hypothetical protein n=1 Tax=uncultured Rhizobium sp. TaxID=155567 RepID=UPI00261D1BAB|nr:hypothetical protein [uncultured Rhizobium sp.]
MHMLLVIAGGTVLLGLFSLFGKLWGGDVAGVALGARAFIPVWLVVALVNMWVGVTKAGYTAAQELPILFVVFLVPAALAALMAWQLTRGYP